MNKTGCTILIVLVIACSMAHASPVLSLSFDASGQLVGASNVPISGSYYDVSFIDGSCFQLYNNCDESTDFVFTLASQALAASHALNELVLLDIIGVGDFDTDSALIRGCNPTIGPNQCMIYTPYQLRDSGVLVSFFDNSSGDFDQVGLWPWALYVHGSTIQIDIKGDSVYAVWSEAVVVPLPGALGLYSLGLVCFSFFGLRSPVTETSKK